MMSPTFFQRIIFAHRTRGWFCVWLGETTQLIFNDWPNALPFICCRKLETTVGANEFMDDVGIRGATAADCTIIIFCVLDAYE
jgi:hypothetical protein